MRRVLGLAASVFAAASLVSVPSIPARADRGALMAWVKRLASPEFEGRAAGTPGAARARDFIAGEFRRLGLEPAAPGGMIQATAIPPGRSFVRSGAPQPDRAANVVGTIRGRVPDARLIAVSAHYDHLGRVGGRLYPGADDNASGVAVLLAAGRHFSAHRPRHGLLFIAFDAEEGGLIGSESFVARPPVPLNRLALIVNMDMVSRSDRRELFAAGTAHSPSLRPVLEEVSRRAAIRLRLDHDGRSALEDWTNDSDHWPFHRAGIPFVYFGVEDHPDYHQPTDTPERIDEGFFGDVADLVIETLTLYDRSLP